MEAVRAVFASDSPNGQPNSFELQSDTTPMSLDGSFLTADQLASEVAYYFDLADAYGSALGLSILSNRDETGAEIGYSRYVRSLGTRPLDAGALVAVEDTATGNHDWDLAGLTATGSLPPLEVFALMDLLARVAPVLDYATSQTFAGLSLQWNGGTEVLDVSAASGVAMGQFSYAADDGLVFATVAFAPCSRYAADATPLDQELADALAPST